MTIESDTCPVIDYCDYSWYSYECPEDPREDVALYPGICNDEDWYTYEACDE